MVVLLSFLIFFGSLFLALSPVIFEFDMSGWITVAAIFVGLQLIASVYAGVVARRTFDQYAPVVRGALVTQWRSIASSASAAASSSPARQVVVSGVSAVAASAAASAAASSPARPVVTSTAAVPPVAAPRLVVQCPVCSRRLRVVADGRRYRCPNCTHHLGRFDTDPP